MGRPLEEGPGILRGASASDREREAAREEPPVPDVPTLVLVPAPVPAPVSELMTELLIPEPDGGIVMEVPVAVAGVRVGVGGVGLLVLGGSTNCQGRRAAMSASMSVVSGERDVRGAVRLVRREGALGLQWIRCARWTCCGRKSP